MSHSGTSQYERLAEELSFNYVKIEERHETDFLNYAAKLADSITYYNQENIPDGSWKSFFEGSNDYHKPHKALFIAFLRLLEALNKHANGLLPKHLDYYYGDILKFTRQNASPRKAYLFFECAKTLQEKLLEKDTLFSAGRNADGKEILFGLVDEIVINKTRLNSLLSLYKHPESFNERIFVADHSEDFTDNQVNEGISIFGQSQLISKKENGVFRQVYKPSENQTMEAANIGFAFSSSMFRLKEGLRTITIRLQFADSIPVFEPEDFLFSCTGEESWWSIDQSKITATIENNASLLQLVITIENTDPAVVPYDQEIHKGRYEAGQPVIKVLLNPDISAGYPYTDWKNQLLKDVTVKVKAENVRSLIFQNDQSVLEASKPYSPFGPIPSLGDHFYIGHSTIFNEHLQYFDLNIQWKDVPDEKLADHYQFYPGNIANDSFRVTKAILDQKVWKESQIQAQIFDTHNAGKVAKVSFTGNDLSGIGRRPTDRTLEKWDYDTTTGFVRLTLSAPIDQQFKAFGHNAYNQTVRDNLNTTNNVNQPYSPIVEQITLDYETKEISLQDYQIDKFYHEQPFGQHVMAVEGERNPIRLLPVFDTEGVAYFGLEGIKLQQSVSLLFQLKVGSGAETASQLVTDIRWSYLFGDEWIAIDRLLISKDTSNNLLHSGIIRFDLPQKLNTDHKVMPAGQFWLRAEKEQNTAGMDLLQSIHLQAAEVIEKIPGSTQFMLAPGSITKPKSDGRGISKTVQPYASFDGKKEEDLTGFYTRIHERLRHKDRGVTIWDYERLVLEEFSELYKVKCLNHTNALTEVAAGHVMVAIIPDLKNQGVATPFQPRMSSYQRVKIYEFLRDRISPFIYLQVVNPIYEPLRFSLNVGFHQGYDEGFYGRKLHRQIQEFLSPWAFENNDSYGKGLAFGGELHKSTLLKFIEDLSYVDFVNDFTMYHQYTDPAIAAGFQDEINNSNGVYDHSSVETEGPVEKFRIAINAEEDDKLTSLITLNIRFLKGLLKLTDQQLREKFLTQFKRSIEGKTSEGQPITKTLIRSVLKTLYYVDKIFSISYHLDLPDGVVLEEVDVAVAKTSRSVMVTSEQHRIGVYSAGDYKCEGNVLIGIGVMIVEADFIVSSIKTENNEYQGREKKIKDLF
ncbi:MAG: hypothetical protein WBA74_00620 [Cyclobacteriaceae bacterium]